MSVEGLKVGDVVVGDVSSNIKEGKIIAFTPAGHAIVEITVVGCDQYKEIGDLYLIDKDFDFYNKKESFFSVGKKYGNPRSYRATTYDIKDLYQVANKSYAVAISSSIGREDTLVILAHGDFQYMSEVQ